VSDKNRPLKRDALETTTAERLAAIVEAAERAATKVIDDAEAEARRYLAEARQEAEEVLGRADRLLEALTAARDRLRAELDVGADAGADLSDGLRSEPRTHLSAVESVAEEEPAAPSLQPAPEPRPRHESGPAGARLLATQMAVSGSSREEIAARLRNGFEIEDADGILDAILGPEEG
jgi:cell division septum initiation protein DivIVA